MATWEHFTNVPITSFAIFQYPVKKAGGYRLQSICMHEGDETASGALGYVSGVWVHDPMAPDWVLEYGDALDIFNANTKWKNQNYQPELIAAQGDKSPTYLAVFRKSYVPAFLDFEITAKDLVAGSNPVSGFIAYQDQKRNAELYPRSMATYGKNDTSPDGTNVRVAVVWKTQPYWFQKHWKITYFEAAAATRIDVAMKRGFCYADSICYVGTTPVFAQPRMLAAYFDDAMPGYVLFTDWNLAQAQLTPPPVGFWPLRITGTPKLGESQRFAMVFSDLGVSKPPQRKTKIVRVEKPEAPAASSEPPDFDFDFGGMADAKSLVDGQVPKLPANLPLPAAVKSWGPLKAAKSAPPVMLGAGAASGLQQLPGPVFKPLPQGMVLKGGKQDQTKSPGFYDDIVGPQLLGGFDAIDDRMLFVMRRNGIRAGQVAVGYKGKLVYGAGYTVAEDGYPITQPTTMLRVGSLSKPMTALGVWRLIDKQPQTFPLAQPILETLLNRTFQGNFGATRTLGHLLAHLAYLDDATIEMTATPWAVRDYNNKSYPVDVTDRVDFMTTFPITMPNVNAIDPDPVTLPISQYSGNNYLLLGDIVRIATGGQSYQQAMKNGLFKDAGIPPARGEVIQQDSGLAPQDTKHARAHQGDPGYWVDFLHPQPDNQDTVPFSYESMAGHMHQPSGSWSMAAVDLVRLLCCMDLDPNPLFTNATRDKLYEEVAQGLGYGFGVGTSKGLRKLSQKTGKYYVPNVPNIGFGGAVAGGQAYWQRTSEGVVFATALNCNIKIVSDLMGEIQWILSGLVDYLGLSDPNDVSGVDDLFKYVGY